jgi:hypothetical protein
MAIKTFVQESLDAGEVIALISLDVQGAFEAALWPGFLRDRKQSNCPKNLYNLTMSYFTQRTAALTMNSLRTLKPVSRGWPQGSCCGPGFWNLHFNSLLQLKFMTRTKVVAYADDLLIAIRANSVRAVENYANAEMSKIDEWSRRNKIKFNDKKSKVMLVTRRKRREYKNITIYLHFQLLEQVTQIKYLEIFRNYKFKFQEHVTYVAERCTKIIRNLSRATKLSWRLKNVAIATMYKGAILPLLTYSAPVWIDAMKYEHNRQKYIRVQRLINLKLARAYRTTSSEAQCILTGIIPITLKLEEAVTIHFQRHETAASHEPEPRCRI